MRDLFFAAVLSCALVSGCREGDVAGSSVVAPPSPPRPPGSSAPAAAPAPVTFGRDVALAFRDRDDAPVVGRTVRVVDARGARSEGLTDEEGGVVVPNVVAPYDVLVEGSPSLGARGTPTILLGLGGAEIAWRLDEHDESPPPPSQTFRLAVPMECGAPTCEAWLTTTSPSGRGAAHLEARPAGGVEVVSLVHAFFRATLEPGERVSVRAVVASADGAALSVAEAMGDASPADVTDMGTLSGTALSTREVIAELDRSGVGPDWATGLEATLRVHDGPDVVRSAAAGPVLAFRGPDAPDAVACVRAWAERPSPGGDDLHAGAQAFACPRGASRVTLSLATPLEPIAPRPGDAMSRRGQGIRWSASPAPRIIDLRLVDERAGRVVVRVVTSGSEVSTTALARLGVVLPLGATIADAQGTEDASLDVASDPRTREPVSFRRTSRRFRFVVTP